MTTKLVIFDKDGTLIRFDDFWVPISRCALAELLGELQAPAELLDTLLEALGVVNGGTDVQGTLSWGTYRQMGEVIYRALQEAGVPCELEQVARLTHDTYHHHPDAGRLLPTCGDLRGALLSLKQRGCRLAVVTTDGPAITDSCLVKLGIRDLFDAVCTADGVLPPKPDPYCIGELARRFGLSREEMVMVGDTETDVRFAQNGGIRVVAVAASEKNRAFLADKADCVVPDVSHVEKVLEAWDKE